MGRPRVTVLRYGHRIIRDERVTTHCGLVAWAFGAERIVLHGERDPSLEKSLKGVAEEWGGTLDVTWVGDWKKALKAFKVDGAWIVHLTMYGEVIEKTVETARKKENVVVVVGGQKVPRGVYELADQNVAVGNLPHSEISALAVYLHELFGGKEFEKERHGRRRIQPSPKGKDVRMVRG